jgi:hypothetical protein
VVENQWDWPFDVSQGKLHSTKCVNCGAIDDPVMVTNRLHSHLGRIAVQRL